MCVDSVSRNCNSECVVFERCSTLRPARIDLRLLLPDAISPICKSPGAVQPVFRMVWRRSGLVHALRPGRVRRASRELNLSGLPSRWPAVIVLHFVLPGCVVCWCKSYCSLDPGHHVPVVHSRRKASMVRPSRGGRRHGCQASQTRTLETMWNRVLGIEGTSEASTPDCAEVIMHLRASTRRILHPGTNHDVTLREAASSHARLVIRDVLPNRAIR